MLCRIHPDHLSAVKTSAKFETFKGKHVLSDGKRRSNCTRSPSTATTMPVH